MFDNNLVFSLLLSLINTGVFIAFTHKEDFDKKKQEYILLFGLTFAISFILRMLVTSGSLKGGGISTNPLGSTIPSTIVNSSKPPF